ncbi:MAG: Hsp20/alpha crystallin family protein [Armatimonadota bacterium]
MSVFDPFSDLSRLGQQISRLVEERSGTAERGQESRLWRPPVDVFEDSEALTVRLDLPGLDRSRLDVQFTGEELVIRGERPWVAPEQGACIHAERPHGQFHRAFRVGVPVQGDAVEATYRDGVLTVVLPKAETVKPRKIAVRTDSDA